jgi:hypothetical protein
MLFDYKKLSKIGFSNTSFQIICPNSMSMKDCGGTQQQSWQGIRGASA